jgi:hypothetical protein
MAAELDGNPLGDQENEAEEQSGLPPEGEPHRDAPSPPGGPPAAPERSSWFRPAVLIPALGLLLAAVTFFAVTLQDSRLGRIQATENALRITETVSARQTEAAAALKTPTPTLRPLSNQPRVIAYHFAGDSPDLSSATDQAGLRSMGEENWRVFQSEFQAAMVEKVQAGSLPEGARFLFFAFRNVSGGQASEVTVERIGWVGKGAEPSSGEGGTVPPPGMTDPLDSLDSSLFDGNNRWVNPATGEAYDLGEGLSLPARDQAGGDRLLFLLVDAAPGISVVDPLPEASLARWICVWHSYTDLDFTRRYPEPEEPTCLGEVIEGTRNSGPLTIDPFNPW